MTETEKAICIVSGPIGQKGPAIIAIQNAGLDAADSDGAGLPSHCDPITAAAAGMPNSGHTPGLGHPATLDFFVAPGDHKGVGMCDHHTCEHVGGTEQRPNPLEEHIGSDYEDDPSIAFLQVRSNLPSTVADAVDGTGWVLRMYALPSIDVTTDDTMADAERLARVEADLALLREKKGA